MPRQKVILLANRNVSELGNRMVSFFSADQVTNYSVLSDRLSEYDYRALVVDCIDGGFNETLYLHVLSLVSSDVLSLVLLVDEATLDQKIKACELGFDDVIVAATSSDETAARITKAIFHKIASRQLLMTRDLDDKQSLSVLNAYQHASTIKFLIEIHDCDNLDQLGQLFFSLITCYKLICSLQMRSVMGFKNMEAHGMSKDFESELLFALSQRDNELDFGKYSVITCRDVSILIKNMPDNDEEYIASKSLARILVQGLSARMTALDNQYRLLREKDLVCQVTQEMRYAVKMIADSHREVIERVLVQLEFVSSSLTETMSSIDVSDDNKAALECALNQCKVHISTIVKDDPAVASGCNRLELSIGNMLALLGMPSQTPINSMEIK